jgi:hypothetical protein
VDAPEYQGVGLEDLFDWQDMTVDTIDAQVTVFDLPAGSFYRAKDKTATPNAPEFDSKNTVNWSLPRATRKRTIEFSFLPPDVPWYWRWMVAPAIGATSLGEAIVSFLGFIASGLLAAGLILAFLGKKLLALVSACVAYWWKKLFRLRETRRKCKELLAKEFNGKLGWSGKPRLRDFDVKVRNEDLKFVATLELESIRHQPPFETDQEIKNDMKLAYKKVYQAKLGISEMTIRAYLQSRREVREIVMYQTRLTKDKAEQIDWEHLPENGYKDIWDVVIEAFD